MIKDFNFCKCGKNEKFETWVTNLCCNLYYCDSYNVYINYNNCIYNLYNNSIYEYYSDWYKFIIHLNQNVIEMDSIESIENTFVKLMDNLCFM